MCTAPIGTMAVFLVILLQRRVLSMLTLQRCNKRTQIQIQSLAFCYWEIMQYFLFNSNNNNWSCNHAVFWLLAITARPPGGSKCSRVLALTAQRVCAAALLLLPLPLPVATLFTLGSRLVFIVRVARRVLLLLLHVRSLSRALLLLLLFFLLYISGSRVVFLLLLITFCICLQ